MHYQRSVQSVMGVPTNRLLKDVKYVRTINGQDGDVTVSANPAGSDKEVQYNDSGSFGSSAYYTFDNSVSRLDVFSGLGSEKLTNGSFTGNATGWTLGSGWAYSSNTVSHTSNGTASLAQNAGLSVGRIYVLSFVVSNWTVGSITPTIGGVTLAAASANGTYTYRVVPATTGTLSIVPSNTARLTIDSVSVKELTGGQVSSGRLGVGGAVVDTNSTLSEFIFEASNSAPGTTRHLRLSNPGGNTYMDFSFAGTLRAAIGATSSGALRLYQSGGSGIEFYSGVSGSPTLDAYVFNSGFVHQSGYGAFGSGTHAGSASAPTSSLQSAGGTALKVKRVAATQALDNTATHWLLDATSAVACAGTPDRACSFWTNETDCEKWDAHGGCTWNPGSDCSIFSGDFATCSGTSGCSTGTSSCSGAGDQTACEAQDDEFGGSCTWDETTDDCATFNDNYESCVGNGGCSWSAGIDCSTLDNTDESTCTAESGCSWNSGDNTCSGTCSGTYGTGNFVCNGTYNNSACSGTYGSGCSGTSSCAGINDQTNCELEDSCVWSSVLSVSLPDGETCPDRTYWLYNDSSGGQDVVISPFAGQTVNETTSYTLGAYRDWAHFAYFKKTASCSGFNEGACTPTGCSPAYSSCIWEAGDSTCTGGDGCSDFSGTDQGTCESNTYFNTCVGTYVVSKNWYKFGS
jgi:hypothetical protein